MQLDPPPAADETALFALFGFLVPDQMVAGGQRALAHPALDKFAGVMASNTMQTKASVRHKAF